MKTDIKKAKDKVGIDNIVINLGINDPNGKLEYFQGKNKGDIYIKVPKKLDIDVNVNTLSKDIKIKSLNELKDEYHSIGELYEFRKYYNALLFNEWAEEEGWKYPVSIKDSQVELLDRPERVKGKYDVHKSWRHNDGELCFGGGWFIVVAILPSGQITNHYKAEDWDLFQIPELEKAKYEFDGHTPQDTLIRMKNLLTK